MIDRRQRITAEVLRGFRAMASALTAPQAEHPDVRAACEWLLAANSGASVTSTAAVDRDRLMQVAKETRDEHVRNQWLNADCMLRAVVNRVLDEIEGKLESAEEST